MNNQTWSQPDNLRLLAARDHRCLAAPRNFRPLPPEPGAAARLPARFFAYPRNIWARYLVHTRPLW
jgi:hypothetical protein